MSPIPILEQSLKSVYLQMQFNGTAIAKGTGFVANSSRGPVLVTARHNVTGRHHDTNQPLSSSGGIPNEVLILYNRKGPVGHWVGRVRHTELLLTGESPRWIEHPRLGSQADFVALPLTQIDDAQLSPYSLGIDDPQIKISPTDTVSVVGFPFGLISEGSLAIWATGFVATEPAIDHDGLPVFLIDCRARQGQSGSPVVAHRNPGVVSLEDGSSAIRLGPANRFLGIYSGRINIESDLGIVWKASAIRELVDAIR